MKRHPLQMTDKQYKAFVELIREDRELFEREKAREESARREPINAQVKAGILKTLDDAGPVLTSLVDIEQVASIVFRAIERGDIPRVLIEY